MQLDLVARALRAAETEQFAGMLLRPGPDRGRVFDGHVVTPTGSLLVRVTGYCTTDLGQAADLAHAVRLT
jgi:hypothetical protein